MAKAKKTVQKKEKSGVSYVLKVSLRDSEPLIWRKIQVPADSNLAFLHAVIQIVMGWTNSHLHHFMANDRYYIDPALQDGDDMGCEYQDSFKVSLAEIAPKEGCRFRYEYDFGDGWSHEVAVEKILPSGDEAGKAVCLDGANACPPEDCGGMGGYEDLLKVIRNPGDPGYKEMIEWLGGSFDPAKFDLKETNKYLSILKQKSPSQENLSNILMKRDGVD